MGERVNYRARSVKDGAKLLFFRFDSAGGDFGDEMAGAEAFAVSAEVVSEAREDLTFSGRQGFQAGMRYFFSGLGIPFEFFLAGNSVEFRLGRAWAKRADANSVGFHFFSEAFREKQIESFRSCVGRNIRNGLERSSGCENKNIAATAGAHFPQI